MSKAYVFAFDELNMLIRESFTQTVDKPISKKSVEQLEDDFLDYLIDAYTLGVHDTEQVLGFTTTVNIERMREAIYKDIAGKTVADRIRDDMDSLEELSMLARSEYHRVYNIGVMDAGTDYTDTHEGVQVMKTWVTMLDERVRDTHDYLESTSVPIDEYFYTYDGDSAMYPGDFTQASNNVNCRCAIELSIAT